MKHNEQLFDAIGGIDTDIIAASAPGRQRRTHSTRRILSLAACGVLAVILGLSAWRMHTPETKQYRDPHQGTEMGNVESVPATMHELSAIIPRWEEQTNAARFLEFAVGEARYHTRDAEIDAASVGEHLGQTTMQGYDIYTDTTHEISIDYYAVTGISTECALAVRFAGEEAYYVYVNYWYRPETLQDMFDDLNLRQNMTFGDFHASHIYEDGCYEQVTFHDPDDAIVYEWLLSDTSLPNVWSDNGWYLSRLSVSVDIPLLGYENVGLWVTEDGYLCTNILETGKAFYIGEERVREFITYVIFHCTDRTVTVIHPERNEAQTSYDDGDSGIVEMTSQGYNPDRVETAVEGQTTAAPPYLPGAVTSPAYHIGFTTSEE